MKKLLAAMFVALLMGGCGGEAKKPAEDMTPSNQSSAETPPVKSPEVAKIDLDDNEPRDKIIAEAIDVDTLQKRGKKGEELYYSPNEQTLYTGWGKEMHDNGRIKSLIQVKEGKMSGLVNAWYENGQKKLEGYYKDGKPNGPATSWFDNGQKEWEMNYKDGKKYGLSTSWYRNGQKEVEGTLKDDMPDGVMVRYNEDGTEDYHITYKDGKRVFRNYNKMRISNPQPNQTSPQTPPAKPSAVSKIDLDDPVILEKIIADAIDVQKLQNRSNSGSLMFAPMKQIPYTGWSKYITAKGQVLELRQWEKGRWEDGLNIQFYESGKNRSKSNFKQGRRDGLFTEWYESGHRKFVENYKEGHLDGFSTDWYESGQKQGERNYKDGKKDGLWTEWYENGKKKGEVNYKAGKRDGKATRWYENGQIASEENWKQGIQRDAICWKPDGARCSVSNLKDGNGVLVSYYPNGRKRDEANFKEGKRNGLWTSWYENGQKKREENCKNGNPMSSVAWKPNGEKVTNIESGKRIYEERCASCHQINGLGIPKNFPPLAGSKWVTFNPGIISKIIIKGLKGEIMVKGKTYDSNLLRCLPPKLTNQEIANVVTYVRQAWGNSVPGGKFEVTEEQVSDYRIESESKIGHWTFKELKALYPLLLTDQRE